MIRRRTAVIALAVIAALSIAMPAVGASPSSLAKKAVKIAKKADKRSKSADKRAKAADKRSKQALAKAGQPGPQGPQGPAGPQGKDGVYGGAMAMTQPGSGILTIANTTKILLASSTPADVDVQTHSGMLPGGSNIIAPVDGIYRVEATLEFNSAPTGTTTIGVGAANPAANAQVTGTWGQASGLIKRDAGESVSFWVTNVGGTATISRTNSRLSLQLVQPL